MKPGAGGRTSHERNALAPFQERAQALGHAFENGQGSTNQIPIKGKVYYQFGDLRVELPEMTILVEVECSGGVTNLAKYWECYESGRLTKPIKLLHLFRQMSRNDYGSHTIVWQFLCQKMHEALGDRFEGRWLSPSSLDPALVIFEGWLEQGRSPVGPTK